MLINLRHVIQAVLVCYKGLLYRLLQMVRWLLQVVDEQRGWLQLQYSVGVQRRRGLVLFAAHACVCCMSEEVVCNPNS